MMMEFARHSACTALLPALLLYGAASDKCTTDLQERWRAIVLHNEEGMEMMANERAKGRYADRVKMCWFAITIPRQLLKLAQEYYPACDPANTSEIERVKAYADNAAAFAKSNCWNQNDLIR